MKSVIELRITLLWLLWLQSPIKCGPITCPLSKNIARYGPNGEIVDCVHCPNCPIGQGLSVPCGSKVSNNSKIECVFCEPKKTYSDDHGRGHCKTCQDCGVRNVIQECTINQNRECGKTCPKGYYFDIKFDDCLAELEPEIPTTTSMLSTRTVKLETNGIETTETQSKREAYDVTSTASSQPQFPSTGVDNTPSQGTSLKGTDSSPYVWSTKEVQLRQDNKALLIVICVLLAAGIVVTIVVLVIVCKKGQDRSTQKRDEESTDSAEENFRLTASDESEGSSEATISGSSTQEDLRDPAPQDNTTEPLLLVDIPTDNNISVRNEVSSHTSDAQGEDDMTVENIPADIHVSQMEMLGDVNGTLFMYVQTQLDAGETCTRKTWRSVGRELKVHSDKLNLIQADGRSPTECLLEYFKTLAKEPTMREFVQALKNCGRNDIARYICNWPWAN